ncbi:spore coat protein [Oceanobacillus sp. FSL H7-0719]|uniref:spore coat protein n=1 Tax=Oceanobacillus sp. FSL H7-0719 TaxID=2954507 RepID=UPI003251C32A
MSDSSKQPVPNKVVEVLVDSILRKNGVQSDHIKKEIPEEQKKMIKEMVEDLKLQVEEFNKNNKGETKE